MKIIFESREELYAVVLNFPPEAIQDCNGTSDECLLAGWTNAIDTEKELGELSDKEFFRIALSEVNNMHPGKYFFIETQGIIRLKEKQPAF